MTTVKCGVCPHACELAEGQYGLCHARENVAGKVYPINYGCATATALDPIEKKPFARFEPGSKVFSIGSFGCNLRCDFCQNYAVSLEANEAGCEMITPEEAARLAKSLAPRGNIGIAYTYNEPLIAYEYVMDTAKLIRAQNQKNVVVTNGYINEEPLREVLPYIDAMNIDLKGYSEEFYRSLGGDLQTVKRTIETAAGFCHVEVTTLIIPGVNDSPEEIRDECAFLATVNPEIPLHLTRYFPAYKMRDKEPTPLETLHELKKIAEQSLKYVYLGNV